jgi:myo-inositol 2-dehydrogenase / D-chiro-inositol 1-dehydrogenase
MKENLGHQKLPGSRRDFLKSTATVVGGTILGSSLPLKSYGYFNGSDDTLKVALIGCGARGAGAAVNALRTKGNVKLVAMADVFRDKLDEAYAQITKLQDIKNLVQVPEEHKFTGFDAYKQAIPLADVVLLVTPGAFRPMHFEFAVNAGKHVFMDKPLASDAPGVRQILATGELATRKNLKVLVGLQNRYAPQNIELTKRILDGEIGDIVTSTDYYMIGPVKHVPRQPGWTEMEFQMRNWRYFNWLWTGSPAGLQIHNTDLVNWVKNAYPVRAQGLGGRKSLNGPEYGDIFNFFFIEYEYADGTKLNSQIRHIAGTFTKGGAFITGMKGVADYRGSNIKDHKGNILWRNRESYDNPFQIQTDILFDAIRNNKPHNDTEWGAKSTMTTIMGRMAAHSGQMLEWDDALNSDLSILPKAFAWDAPCPSMPGPDGEYPVPVPGSSPIL